MTQKIQSRNFLAKDDYSEEDPITFCSAGFSNFYRVICTACSNGYTIHPNLEHCFDPTAAQNAPAATNVKNCVEEKNGECFACAEGYFLVNTFAETDYTNMRRALVVDFDTPVPYQNRNDFYAFNVELYLCFSKLDIDRFIIANPDLIFSH
jgi:hypothetical protein